MNEQQKKLLIKENSEQNVHEVKKGMLIIDKRNSEYSHP